MTTNAPDPDPRQAGEAASIGQQGTEAVRLAAARLIGRPDMAGHANLDDLRAVQGFLEEIAEVADTDSDATPEQLRSAAAFLEREIVRRERRKAARNVGIGTRPRNR